MRFFSAGHVDDDAVADHPAVGQPLGLGIDAHPAHFAIRQQMAALPVQRRERILGGMERRHISCPVSGMDAVQYELGVGLDLLRLPAVDRPAALADKGDGDGAIRAQVILINDARGIGGDAPIARLDRAQSFLLTSAHDGGCQNIRHGLQEELIVPREDPPSAGGRAQHAEAQVTGVLPADQDACHAFRAVFLQPAGNLETLLGIHIVDDDGLSRVQDMTAGGAGAVVGHHLAEVGTDRVQAGAHHEEPAFRQMLVDPATFDPERAADQGPQPPATVLPRCRR